MTTTTTNLQSYREAAPQIVQHVFSTMLATETWPAEEADAERPSHPVVGAVYFAGSWNGAALFECEREQAFIFTAELMSIDSPDSVNDDVRDTMGEIVNMLAGNLKPLMPPETALSVPSVVEGSNFTLRLIGSNRAERLAFGSSHGSFWVSVVEMVSD